jgi:hypothetical protein
VKAPFATYNFKQQALSINGRVADLRRAIRAHMRRAASEGRDPIAVQRKCIDQVRRMCESMR